jgi:YVTN family beta-propeller protein
VPDESSSIGVRTFLIADVRGYTRYTQDSGDEAAAALAARFAVVVGRCAAETGGELVELRGDEALVAYDSARRALLGSIELQRQARTDLLLPIGIGLDAGEAVPMGAGYRGGALNLAARLCSIARPGEVLASQTVVSLAGAVDGLRTEERRPVAVKGRDQPVRPVQVKSVQPLPPVPSAPPTRPPAKRRRPGPPAVRPILAALALIAVATAGVAAVIVHESGSTGADGNAVAANSIAVLDARSGDLVATIAADLGGTQDSIAYGNGYVWTFDAQDKVLYRIDARTRELQRQGLGDEPTDVATGAGRVWVAFGFSDAVSEVSPNDFTVGSPTRIVSPREARGGSMALAYAGGQLWVADGDAHGLIRVDTTTGRVRTVSPESAVDVATAGQAVWVSENWGAVTLWHRIAPSGHELGQAVIGNSNNNGSHPADLADLSATPAAVWFVDTTTDRLVHVDPSSPSVASVIHIGRAPTGVAADPNGSVWVANSVSGTVSMVDPMTDRIVRTIRLGHSPTSVAVGGGYVWVTVQTG